MGAAIGDTFTCCRKYENTTAVHNTNAKFGIGKDIDEAVLAATNQSINNEGRLVNMVSLSIACENLPNLDTFTRTDAMAILYQYKGNIWAEIGRTEIIMDNLNPSFIKSFTVDYRFEERQKFLVKVFDVDDFSENAPLDRHDFVGELEFQLHEVVTSRNQQLRQLLHNKGSKYKSNGTIVITADECNDKNNEMVDMQLQVDIDDSFGFYFFIILRTVGQNEHVPVYKSENKQSQNRNIKWNSCQILTATLCKEDDQKPILVEIYKAAKNGKHKNIGGFKMNLGQIKENQSKYTVMKGNVRVSEASFVSLKVQTRYTFLEYVFGGCQINLSVAIDFTLSNGNPQDRDSLHYFDASKNEYIQAIKSVGNILQYYDSDKQIPVLGFGAKVPPVNNRASHCFAVNGDIFNPEVDGIDGVIEAYQNALPKINFHGPTHFSEVIKFVADMAKAQQVSQQNQSYFILLLLTDGIINDMRQTIDEIVAASSLPLSIIIVGVGEEDYKCMDTLDADEEPLYSEKLRKYMERDIVQFVPFREFKNNPILLAKQTLEEVPNQLLSFFQKQNIVPKRVLEAEKRKIMSQLSKQNTGRSIERQEAPEYFVQLKEQFVQKCIEMGLEYTEIINFLEDKGLPELSYEIIMDFMNNPQYFNPLRQNQAQHANINHNRQEQRQVPNVAQPQRVSQVRPQVHYDFFDADQQIIQMERASSPKRNSRKLPPLINSQQQDPQAYTKDECKVCMINKINTALVPCGHRCICKPCTVKIKNVCPICRQKVTQVLQVFDA